MESQTLVSIYRGFREERNKFLGARWKRILGYLCRTLGLQREFMRLLYSENEFQVAMFKWIQGHIQMNKLAVDQVSNIKTSIELFKEELNGRNLFLVLFFILLGLSATLYGFIDQRLGKSADPILIGVNTFFGIAAVLERGNIASHLTSSSQLLLFIDKWLEAQGQELIRR